MSDRLMFRQVNPNWVKDNGATSQAFKPSQKDNGLVSVYNGNHFSAQTSFDHFTSSGNFSTAGVVGVSSLECSQIPINIKDDDEPFVGHSSLDFRELSRKQIENTAKRLKAFANDRGWLFRP